MAGASPLFRITTRPPLVCPSTRGIATPSGQPVSPPRARENAPSSSSALSRHPLKSALLRSTRAAAAAPATLASTHTWESAVPHVKSFLAGVKLHSMKKLTFYCSMLVASVGSTDVAEKQELFFKVANFCLKNYGSLKGPLLVQAQFSLLAAIASDKTVCYENPTNRKLFLDLCCSPMFQFSRCRTQPEASPSLFAMEVLLSQPLTKRSLVPPPVLEGMVFNWKRLDRHEKRQRELMGFLRKPLFRELILLSQFIPEQRFKDLYYTLFLSVKDTYEVFWDYSIQHLHRIPGSAMVTILEKWCSIEPRRLVGGQDALVPENLELVVNSALGYLVGDGAPLSMDSYRVLLDACWACRNDELALRVYRNMRDQGIQPSVKLFGQTLRLCMSNQVTVKLLWEDMCKEFKSCPPVGMFCYLMEALAFQSQNPRAIDHVHGLIIERAKILITPYSATLYSAEVLLWSFYAATVSGSVADAVRLLDVMVDKGTMPDLSVLSLMWRMVRSRQDFLEIIKALLGRMIRWRIEASKEFIVEGAAALGQLTDPLLWKSKVWSGRYLRTDLMTSFKDGLPQGMAAAQAAEERRMVTIMLAIFQQVNMEIACADRLYTYEVPINHSTVSAEVLCLGDAFYLSSSAKRPGSDESNLTKIMAEAFDSVEEDLEPLFADSSLASCIETLASFKTVDVDAANAPI